MITGRTCALPLLALLILILALSACAGGPKDISALLLAPSDFPGMAVTEISREATETTEGGDAAQVFLQGPDFELRQSLVMFQQEDEARLVLDSIKRNQKALGKTPRPLEGFQEASGVITEDRGGVSTSTMFFLEGRVLVRLDVAGTRSENLLEVYAEKARARVAQ